MISYNVATASRPAADGPVIANDGAPPGRLAGGSRLGGLAAPFADGLGLRGMRGTDALQEHGSRLVVRVLGHQLAAEGFGEVGLVEVVEEVSGASHLRRYGINVCKCNFDTTNDFQLLVSRRHREMKVAELFSMNVLYHATCI